MFIVAINLWTSDHEDYYDFEYSGVEHATREEAETELAEAKNFVEVVPHGMDVKSVYIREV